jgi:hypothetical protein
MEFPVSRTMRKCVLAGLCAALIVGLSIARAFLRSQPNASSSSVGGLPTRAQATDSIPAGETQRCDAAAAPTSGADTSPGKALPGAAASQAASRPAGALSSSRLQSTPRAPQTRPRAAAPRMRMQAAASGPSSRPGGPLVSTREARIRAAAPMARRLIQASGSQPSSQPAADTARLMQRRSAQSPMAASYANLWAYAGRAKAQTQSAPSGPATQPRSLASQGPRLHETRRGGFRWATTQAVSPEGIDGSWHSESTGSK